MTKTTATAAAAPSPDELSRAYWTWIQERLNAHGVTVPVTGEWDGASDAALMRFKGSRQPPLRDDRSLVGPLTREELAAKPTAPTASETPWLDYMLRHLGLREIPGANDNQIIVKWGKQAGIDWWNNDDDAWCAVAVNGALVNTGYRSSASALARSFVDDRFTKRLDKVGPGAIVVFPRGRNPLYGHVGVVEEVRRDGTILIVNGNVGDAMVRSVRRVDEVLPDGIRWPIAA